MSFSDLYISQLKGTRDTFGREEIFTTGTAVPITPVSVLIDVWHEWSKAAEQIAAAGIAPTADGLIIDDDAFGGDGGLVDQFFPGHQRAENMTKAGLALADIRSGDSARVIGGMTFLKRFQTGSQRPIEWFLEAAEKIAGALKSWVFHQRAVGEPPVSVIAAVDAQNVWAALRKVAITADAASRKTVSLISQIEAFVEGAAKGGKVAVETAAEAAARLAAGAGDLFGDLIASFASASGIITLVAIGGGIWFLSTSTGAGVAAKATAVVT